MGIRSLCKHHKHPTFEGGVGVGVGVGRWVRMRVWSGVGEGVRARVRVRVRVRVDKYMSTYFTFTLTIIHPPLKIVCRYLLRFLSFSSRQVISPTCTVVYQRQQRM
jgi:hypothetical protein